MTKGAQKKPYTVERHGVKVVIEPNGDVVVHTEGEVQKVHPAPKGCMIGDKMPEDHPYAGWIYEGISTATNKPFYIAPETKSIEGLESARYPSGRNGNGGEWDGRVPTREELFAIFANHALDRLPRDTLRGSFNPIQAHPNAHYAYGIYRLGVLYKHRTELDIEAIRCQADQKGKNEKGLYLITVRDWCREPK